MAFYKHAVPGSRPAIAYQMLLVFDSLVWAGRRMALEQGSR